MTVIIPVRDVTYSGDALRGRIDDLGTALEHGMAAIVSSGAWIHDGPDRIRIAERIRVLLAEVSRIRAALLSVWSTIYADERSRSETVGGAAHNLAVNVMSGPAVLAVSAWNGQLWPTLRPLADQIIDALPRHAVRDVDVIVTAGSSSPVSAPRNLRDRVERIPSGDTHIRIERYPTDAGNRFEVYLSGTNFHGDRTDPWNTASNADLALTGSSPSLQAVRTAMQSAGITVSTPVVLTGHSQGGLIALAVARSSEFTVDAIVTIGTPVGVVPDVEGIRTIHVIHPEDPVPALGGLIAHDSTTWVVPVAHNERLFDAHHRDSYVPSVARIDALDDPRIEWLHTTVDARGVGVGRDYRAVNASGRLPGTDAE